MDTYNINYNIILNPNYKSNIQIMYFNDFENQFISLDKFLIFNNNANKNILFLGSCRCSAYLTLFQKSSYIRSNYNLYYISCFYYKANNHPIPLDKIANVINNAHIIIHEYINSYDVLNTEKSCEKNIFNSFNPNAEKYILLPNLYLLANLDIIFSEQNESKIYLNNLVNNNTLNYENFLEIYDKYFITSFNRLKDIINKTDIPEFNYFLENNFRFTKFFNTVNHPTNYTLLLITKIILLKFFNIYDLSYFETDFINHQQLLGGDNIACEYDKLYHGLLYYDDFKPIGDLIKKHTYLI